MDNPPLTASTPLLEVLKRAPACSCATCTNGCLYGAGYLADGDAENIAQFLKISVEDLQTRFLETGEKFNTPRFRPRLLRTGGKPYGRCIFYDDTRGCTIHPVKPLHCKVATHGKEGVDHDLWFTLNYFVNKHDPESIRQWATYLKTHPTIPGGKLEDLVPNKELLKKILEYDILH